MKNLKTVTGKSLAIWMETISDSKLMKNREITKYLKDAHKLNHAQASNLAAIFLNDGKPVHSDHAGLFDHLFSGKEHQKDLYDRLIKKLLSAFETTVITPRKSYIQLDAKRTFAVIKINKSNIRLGLDLGDQDTDGVVTKAKSLGAMPRFSHMIELKSKEDLGNEIIDNVQKSLDRSS